MILAWPADGTERAGTARLFYDRSGRIHSILPNVCATREYRGNMRLHQVGELAGAALDDFPVHAFRILASAVAAVYDRRFFFRQRPPIIYRRYSEGLKGRDLRGPSTSSGR